MDILAHGLWTAAAYRMAANKNRRFRLGWAVFWGLAPDMFSFGIHTFAMMLGLSAMPFQFGSEPTEVAHLVPKYVSILYSWTHSLVIFTAAFLIIWWLTRRFWWEMGAWGLHILIDIPTHTDAFFPTPFLWPLSDVRVSGISWGEPWFMVLNYGALLGIWLGLFLRDRLGGLIKASGK